MNHIVLKAVPDADLADKWNAFLAEAPFATHYVTPNYFSDPYVSGDRFAVLATDDTGRIAAVLTGVASEKEVVSGLFSRPQMVFRNCSEQAPAASALFRGVEEIGVEADLLELYSWQPVSEFRRLGLSPRMSSESTSVVMLDLAHGAEAVFARFSQTRRNEIRKAERQAAVEVKTLETDAELKEVYRIHCEWNTRKGNRADTFEQMRTAVSQTENRRVFIAKLDGRVIAASFYRFCPGGVVEYAANFSMPEFQKHRPNDLIGWNAIRWACESGFSHFSMGGSHLFLRRFGGEIVQTYRYRQDRSLFRIHDLTERAREISVAAATYLPDGVRDKLRQVLSR